MLCTGVSLEFLPTSNQDALVLCNGLANLTLIDVHLANVSARQHTSILSFVNSSNIVVDGLLSNNCTCNGSLIAVKNGLSTSNLPPFLLTNSQISNISGVSVTNTSSTFVNTSFGYFNSSGTQNGTAINIVNRAAGNATITNCTFGFLKTSGWGGAVSISAATTIVQQSTFTNNSAASGGAIFLQTQPDPGGQFHNVEANISACTFQNNRAVNVGDNNGTGGAVYMGGSLGNANEKYSVLNSIFTNNTATGASSDILTWGVRTLSVEGSYFQGGRGAGGAGVLYAYGLPARYTQVTIRSSIFTNGGGFCSVQLSSCSCTGIVNSTFSDTLHRGLCIQDANGACEGSDAYLFNRSTISSTADNHVISDFLGDDVSISVSVDIRNSTFESLTPQFHNTTDALFEAGALVFSSTGPIIMAGLTFLNNLGRQGAAVHLDACPVAVIWHSTFTGNVAAYEGGAIALVNSHSTIEAFQHGSIVSASAHGTGLLIGASTFSNNPALSGGAIYGNTGANIVVNSTNIHNNTLGGAFHCLGCETVQLQSSIVASNVAGDAGGGCYLGGCVQVMFLATQIYNNRQAV